MDIYTYRTDVILVPADTVDADRASAVALLAEQGAVDGG